MRIKLVNYSVIEGLITGCLSSTAVFLSSFFESDLPSS